ncbi:mitochondrial intermembrane space import and assembly protein 40 homolog isoform X2 [Elaeis guineensis]|uniref:mitochondrial intermembrane space import and assembly protein 40 homolog isoform X2 n=1 Tax=Elaeis guineensis var. tenera TaxID=51953 RepID=UPI00057B7E4C
MRPHQKEIGLLNLRSNPLHRHHHLLPRRFPWKLWSQSLDVKAQKALECPCVAELRKGPCGTQFTEAFVCFIKSTAEEKGSDCVNPFIALQDCIKANPDAFSKDVLDEEENESGKGEEKVEDYKIIPPEWSREPKSKK